MESPEFFLQTDQTEHRLTLQLYPDTTDSRALKTSVFKVNARLESLAQPESPRGQIQLDQLWQGPRPAFVWTRVGAHEAQLLTALQGVGMRVVDYSLDLELRPDPSNAENSLYAVHEADSHDFEVIAKHLPNLFRLSRLYKDGAFSQEVVDERFRGFIEEALTSSKLHLLVAKKVGDQNPLGFFASRPISEEACNWDLTAVLPDYQGSGKAFEIWKAMVGREVRRGSKTISTSISADNRALFRLYSKLGFHFKASNFVLHGHLR